MTDSNIDETLNSTIVENPSINEPHNCSLCEEADTINMIPCGICRRIFHLKCVGVNSLNAAGWMCRSCAKLSKATGSKPMKERARTQSLSEAQLGNVKNDKQSIVQPANNDDNITTNTLGPSSGKNYSQDTILSLQQKSNSDSQHQPQSTKNNGQPSTSKGNAIDNGSSKCSSKKRRKEKALAKFAEWEALQNRIFAERWKVLESFTSDSSTDEEQNGDGEGIDKGSRVKNWLEEQQCQTKVTFNIPQNNNNHDKVALFEDQLQPSAGATNASGHQHPQPNEFLSLFDNTTIADSFRRHSSRPTIQNMESSAVWLNPKTQQEFLNSTSFVPSKQNKSDSTNTELKQIALRQVISRDLPNFSGDAEEWPLFISAYVRSTQKCGFTNEENLVRLQRALKGKAFEAVKGSLVLPDLVPQVLNTLRTRFGRPELIIAKLTQKVQSEPKINPEKLEMLLDFASSVQHLCTTMKVCGMQQHLSNPMLLRDLVGKLPASLKVQWAKHHPDFDNVNLSLFNEWLNGEAEAAGRVLTDDVPSVSQSAKPSRRNNTNRQVMTHTTSVQPSNSFNKSLCVVCKEGEHKADDCTTFQKLPVAERWTTLRNLRLCRKCLKAHHVTKCKSIKACGENECKFKHHRLLHDPVLHSTAQTKDNTNQTNVVGAHHHTTTIAARIIPVILYGNHRCIKTFAFLDDGSHLSLIDEELAQQLQLKGPSSDLHLQWTSNMKRVERNSRILSLEISDVNESTKYRMTGVRTVKSLDLPTQTSALDIGRYPHLRDLPVARYNNAKPRMIIGLAHTNLIATLQLREGKWGEPVAARTRLGWTIYGAIRDGDNKSTSFSGVHVSTWDENLDEELKNFFSLEKRETEHSITPPETSEEARARSTMESLTKFENNRYETGLIWKFDDVQLPNSLPMAIRRLHSLERKIARDPGLSAIIDQEIKKYVENGYVRRLQPDEAKHTTGRTWYLPIFIVRNPNKPTKVRLVWDAAAAVGGTSLNSVLLKGPDLLVGLPDILIRFREFAVALSGDIKEMFHQIKIRSEDQAAQRFLWRSGTNQEPDVYVMTVLTFGATCSPYTAHYIKNLNASRFCQQHPRAVHEILNHHYVDDWISSFKTEEEATDLAKTVTAIHQSGGFHIRNWTSNSKKVLEELGGFSPQDDGNLSICRDTSSRILGMKWSASNDCFFYHISIERVGEDILSGRRKPTKREVLRTLMLVFDPLGLISFFMVYLKILMQYVWRAKTGWDEPISDDHFQSWLKWTQQLSGLYEVKVPRCIFPIDPVEVQLHTFVDASEHAYSAVSYLRIKDQEGMRCVLLCAKSKVAPLKTVTIPRLELLAAVIGSRLASWICSVLTIKPSKRIFWSDSQNVLCWLRSEKKHRQFVSFRIAEILRKTEVLEWRWVATKQNVADIATKWQKNPEFNQRHRWFSGPNFLLEPEETWPEDNCNQPSPDTMEEVGFHLFHSQGVHGNLVPPFDKFSKFNKLVRTVGWVLRWFYSQKRRNVGDLNPEEIERAELEIFKKIQFESFGDDIDVLLKQGFVEKTSNLFILTPFLDDNKMLRHRGRISELRNAPYDLQNPIILPGNHLATQLLIMDYHQKYHCQNHEVVVNELRQKFHIVGLRTTLRKVRKICQRCKVNNARPAPPIMADHPTARLGESVRPFTFVGIDLFGPYEISIGRRIEKRWPMVFTCLTVRAVHIEILHSLDKHSCLMGIRNFISRRGVPQEIRSDNGTNFHGANNEIQVLWKSLEPLAREKFTKMKWIFNPPASPHMGGCWERLIRVIKKCLTVSMPHRHPNDEQFRCFLLEAENIVNSRPLTYIPIDSDEEALTPNHFILGSSNGVKPWGEWADDAFILKNNYRTSQRLADYFWDRWRKEYLPDLRRTTKWYKNEKPVEVGDVVLMMENHRNGYKRARVIQTQPGKDGIVRQVVLQTVDGIIVRPVSKVAVLDVIHTEKSESSQQGGECYDRT